MSNHEPILHPVVISQVMINFAARYGIDRETCLAGTDITDKQLEYSETLITRYQELRLIENLILALPTEPALGCKLGLEYNMSTFGVWGFAQRTSRTLRDAMAVGLRYLPLSTTYCRVQAMDEPDHIGVVYDPSQIHAPLRQFLLERDMATQINFLNDIGLAGIQFSRVEFRGPAPEYADYMEEIFGIKPEFNRPRNAVFVSATDANKPLHTFDANLVRLMQDQCRQQLELRQQLGTSGLVRQQILGPLGLVTSIESVSSALGMSPRSLRRKLEREGTTFKHLLDKERELCALQLLESSGMKLDELAFHLGYTDTASFSRAFRRWRGIAPGEYRSQTSNA